jgi:hypothetical protein
MDEFCTRSLRAGLATAIGGEQRAVLLPAQGLVKASRVEGFSTIADRSRRVGRSQSVSQPARIRSDADRFGDRCLERFRIRS